jgi:Bacterial Ig-like domain (group 3)/Galactose oxidase, central domain
MFTTRLRALSVFVVLAAAAGSGLLLAQAPQTVGTWVGVGSADNPFGNGAHVDVGDGHTLIVGGTGPDGAATNVVANFDTATNQFAIAGTLLTARTGHTAILLKDGRVLVTGGTTNSLVSTDIEIFDPSTGASTLVAQMAEPRRGHVAALLQNGRVLIAGGYTTEDAVLQSAFIFDPSTNSVSPTPSGMNVARASASATSLIDGRVVIIGGTSNGTDDLTSAEIYDPTLQSFTNVSTQLSVPLRGHSAVLLPNNGSVLVAGGTSNGAAQAGVDLFLPTQFPDPFSWGLGQFAPTAAMNAARSSALAGPSATEGYAVATGGGSNDVERYRFATIKSDQDDYTPGEYALITGTGWEPGEQVRLLFQEDPAVHEDYVVTVTADGQGNISTNEWAPELHDLNVRFYLMAIGQQSARRAQTTFTDANNFTVSPLTQSVVAGTTQNFTWTLTAANSGNEATTTFTIPAPWPLPQNAGAGQVTVTGCTSGFTIGTGAANRVITITQSGSAGNGRCGSGQTLVVSYSNVLVPTPAALPQTYTFDIDDVATGGDPTVTVSGGTTSSINSDSPDPSAPGQAVTVEAQVLPVAPATGTINEGTFTINATGGLSCTTATVSAGVASCQITFPTVGSQTITATYNGTLNYRTSTSAVEPHAVNASNALPSIGADYSSVTLDEGMVATNTGTWSDQNAGDTVTLSASVGTVTKDANGPGTWSWSFNANDGPSGPLTVTITANDGTGSSQASFTLTVNNVEPTIAISGAGSVNEGSSYNLTLGSVTDPGADTVSSYIVHWGDGSSDTYGSNGVKTHAYADGPNSYSITVDLVDEDGAYLDQANALSVTVNNVEPTIAVSGASNVNE